MRHFGPFTRVFQPETAFASGHAASICCLDLPGIQGTRSSFGYHRRSCPGRAAAQKIQRYAYRPAIRFTGFADKNVPPQEQLLFWVHRLPTSSIKGVPDSARRCPWIQRQFNSFGDRGPVQYQVFLNDYGTYEARFCAEFRPALVPPRSVQKAPLGSQHNFSQIGISSYLTH